MTDSIQQVEHGSHRSRYKTYLSLFVVEAGQTRHSLTTVSDPIRVSLRPAKHIFAVIRL